MRHSCWLRKRMTLEELPHERACLEVGDREVGPTARATTRVLRPTVAHSGDGAENDLDAVTTPPVSFAPGRAHVVRLGGRGPAAVAHRPAPDVRRGARIAHRSILGAMHVDDRD